MATAIMMSGCGIAGLGGVALELNSTNMESRQLVISVAAPGADHRILEAEDTEDVELGRGSVQIEGYVLQKVVFGDNLATGLFLCASPCSQPLDSFLVAYSPERLFAPAGELRLAYRVVTPDGLESELSRTVSPTMLEELWRRPALDIRAGG